MITSPSNARIKAARKLLRRRHREQQGLLLLEGVRLIQDLVATGVMPVELFCDPDQIQGNATALDLVERLRSAGVTPIDCAPAVFAALTETVSPQGVAAVAPLPRLALPQPSTFALILDRLRDPGNAGTLLRSAEAAGVDLVIFGPETVDPFNDKAVRAGMGAHFRVPLRSCDRWDDVMALLAPEQTLYLAQAHAPLPYDAVAWAEPAALVVGGEADGAGPEARQVAIPVSIPMAGAAESLNAAVAGAIILFEAARQRRGADSAV